MTAQYDSDPDLNEDDIPDASELLDFELIAKSQPDKGQGIWLWVVLVLILAGGGWAGWMYWQDTPADETVSADGVPTIMAPKFELREKPVDPGGMDVPDRDKLVYGRMAGESDMAEQGVERLLPPPETPLEPPQSAIQADGADLAADSYALQPDVPQSLAPQSTEPKAVVAVPPAPPAPAAPEAPAPIVEAPAPEAAPAAPAVSEPVVAPAAPSAKQGYLVQLSAVRTEEAAKAEWSRLVKKFPDVLGGLEPVIVRADLGAKGIYYRVRGGWFSTRAEAKAICDELMGRNVGCIVATP
jgi:cell division protein FtsN